MASARGDGDPLLLATGQLVRHGVDLFRQPDPLQELAGPRLVLVRLALLQQARRQHHLAADGEMREQLKLWKTMLTRWRNSRMASALTCSSGTGPKCLFITLF
jgi:hypothetical protein